MAKRFLKWNSSTLYENQPIILIPTAEVQKRHITNKEKKSIEMELLINSNSNSWETLLTIAIVPKMSIAIVISILLISSVVWQARETKAFSFSVCTFVQVIMPPIAHNIHSTNAALKEKS